MHLFGHSLDGANRWDFYPLPSWDDKKVALRGYGFDGRCASPPAVASLDKSTDRKNPLLQLLSDPDDRDRRRQSGQDSDRVV